jgi:RNA polymerase sigma factor (sigma-70 family)
MTGNRILEVLGIIRRTALLGESHGESDGQLLERFVGGNDRLALETLVCRHAPMVWGVCRRHLARRDDAEDAFQATFLVLLRKAMSIRPRERVANWLYGVAYKTARKARQRAAKRYSREKQLETMAELQTEPLDDAFGPELLARLDEELNGLPEKYRIVIVLCTLEGRTRREAAQELRLKEGTVGSRLRRGRQMLAQRLTRRGLGESATSLVGRLSQQAIVPAALMTSTIKIICLLADAETAGAGLITAGVSALAKGVLHAMTVAKKKTAVVWLIMGTLVLGGGIVSYYKLVEPPDTERFGKEEEATEFAKERVRDSGGDLRAGGWMRAHSRARFGPDTNAQLDRENGNWIVTGSLLMDHPILGGEAAQEWKVIASYQTSNRSWNKVDLVMGTNWHKLPVDALIKGPLARPLHSGSLVSSLKLVGSAGEWIDEGEEFSYDENGFSVQTDNCGVTVKVGSPPYDDPKWTLKFVGPGDRSLDVGEYVPDKPGLKSYIEISRQGSGVKSNIGKFVVWEIEVKDNKVARLAIDFILLAENQLTKPDPYRLASGPSLRRLSGSLRFNSSFCSSVPEPEPYYAPK